MKSKILATLALLAISVLPGCGKNNNGVVTNPGYGTGYIGGVNGQGGCYDTRQMGNGGGMQVAFTGYNQQATGIYASLQATNAAVGGGYGYTKTNGGDTVQVFVNGNQVTAIATLSYNTISAVNVYGNGYICGLAISAMVNPGSSQLLGTVALAGNNGYIRVPTQYGYIPLSI